MRDMVLMPTEGGSHMRFGNVRLSHACQTRRVRTDYSLWYDLAAQVDWEIAIVASVKDSLLTLICLHVWARHPVPTQGIFAVWDEIYESLSWRPENHSCYSQCTWLDLHRKLIIRCGIHRTHRLIESLLLLLKRNDTCLPCLLGLWAASRWRLIQRGLSLTIPDSTHILGRISLQCRWW